MGDRGESQKHTNVLGEDVPVSSCHAWVMASRMDPRLGDGVFGCCQDATLRRYVRSGLCRCCFVAHGDEMGVAIEAPQSSNWAQLSHGLVAFEISICAALFC